MASVYFMYNLPILRWQSNWPIFVASNSVQRQDLIFQNKWIVKAVSKKNTAHNGFKDASNVETSAVEKTSKSPRRAPRRNRKKETSGDPEENAVLKTVGDVVEDESNMPVSSADDSPKVSGKSRKKATPMPSSKGESTDKKVSRRRTKKTISDIKDQSSIAEHSSPEELTSIESFQNENKNLKIRRAEEEDISFTYGWPPLVCCFGAAQHAFLPSGRPANRLIDHEIHETKKDMLWSPTKFVRAPGGPSSSVAVALSSLGGRVAFVGKLGDDEYGQRMLYYLNVNNVQTRSVIVDSSKPTAVSYMKIIRRGGLRMTCLKPCAEDCLLSSEINIDVLKEAKMFYFNSTSLLNQDMRSTTMQAIEISKKFGGVIFFDLNLPFPLWQSNEETKMFIQQAWNHANVIEVTKQELEFLCGIEPSEKFDTKDNDRSKFIHHKPEVIMPLWHENLKVLFVTNGTSKVHYYTEKDNGSVHGMEDAPITPFTCDMSAAGDAMVAALMRMLTVQPHLITDKGYLEHMIKYAINCGVTDQWLLGRVRGFPPKEEMKEGLVSELNRVKSITEKEYRTFEPVS